MRDGFRWSPDGTRIAYWQLDASGVRDFLMINDTDSLYSFTIPVQYPKTGTTNSAARVGVVSAAGGETVWLQVEGDPRNNYIARMQWAGNSSEVAIQQLNRKQNTLRLMFGEATTGKVRTILVESDSAWVDLWDNGSLFGDRQDHLRWLSNSSRFFWVSDRDGWRRLYVATRDGARLTPITPPSVDLLQITAVDEKGGWVYYIAAPDDPIRRYLYRVKLDGSFKGARLTPADQRGTHSYNMSPQGKWSAHTVSTFDTPPVIDLVELPAHRSARTLEDNAELRTLVTALRPGRAEFFRVDAGDGVQLDGWMIKPKDFDPVRKYPVLFEVYGEPAGTTVNDAWGGSGMIWHQYLADKGYLVMSLDNRGTPAPRGRAWRKSIYRKVGILSAQDQANGLRAIIAKYPFVDATRIGIWGWSGGGSMTLNMLFRYPELYQTGMAVAPVPDLRLYDTIYQERYTGLPDEDRDAYEQGSPVNFAQQLKGNLLVVHGSGDDNVHYQGTERLVNALVKHGKAFQLMVYPNRSHGIFEGEGTTVHVYSLLTRYCSSGCRRAVSRRCEYARLPVQPNEVPGDSIMRKATSKKKASSRRKVAKKAVKRATKKRGAKPAKKVAKKVSKKISKKAEGSAATPEVVIPPPPPFGTRRFLFSDRSEPRASRILRARVGGHPPSTASTRRLRFETAHETR